MKFNKSSRIAVILLIGIFIISNLTGFSYNSKPTKLTMFFGDAGIKFPQEVNKSNNPFLNIVEKKANVDLEMVQPTYADFETKFKLALSSGQIPDIVHCWFSDEINKNGEAGAFVSLEPYIKKSKVLSKLYPKSYLDLMRAQNGKIYGLVSLGAENYPGTIARVDLINELNNGKIPRTPDDWYKLMKKEKAKYPNSTPYTSRGGLMKLDTFFRAYGAEVDGNGAEWQLTKGKIISAFEAPMMRAAIVFHRKLYNEKLLDPTFVTNKMADWQSALLDKGLIAYEATAADIPSTIEAWTTNGIKNRYFSMIPHPVQPGASLENVYSREQGIGWHTISISSKCKNIDAAVKVIEAFLSPELKLAATWGRKGIEYNVDKEGKKVLNADASAKTSYRAAYGFLYSYWTPETMAIKMSQIVPKMEPKAAKIFQASMKSGVSLNNMQVKKLEIDPFISINLTDSLINMKTQALIDSTTIITKAIVGQISMTEYDKLVADYLKKYDSITKEYNRLYSAKK